jgi:hypothetical protein
VSKLSFLGELKPFIDKMPPPYFRCEDYFCDRSFWKDLGSYLDSYFKGGRPPSTAGGEKFRRELVEIHFNSYLALYQVFFLCFEDICTEIGGKLVSFEGGEEIEEDFTPLNLLKWCIFNDVGMHYYWQTTGRNPTPRSQYRFLEKLKPHKYEKLSASNQISLVYRYHGRFDFPDCPDLQSYIHTYRLVMEVAQRSSHQRRAVETALINFTKTYRAHQDFWTKATNPRNSWRFIDGYLAIW